MKVNKGVLILVLFACNLFSMDQSCFIKKKRRMLVEESLGIRLLRSKAYEEYIRFKRAEEAKRLSRLRILENKKRRACVIARQKQEKEDGNFSIRAF